MGFWNRQVLHDASIRDGCPLCDPLGQEVPLFIRHVRLIGERHGGGVDGARLDLQYLALDLLRRIEFGAQWRHPTDDVFRVGRMSARAAVPFVPG